MLQPIRSAPLSAAANKISTFISRNQGIREYYRLNPEELIQDVLSMDNQPHVSESGDLVECSFDDPTGLLSQDLPDLPDLSESESEGELEGQDEDTGKQDHIVSSIL